ncbi:MAG: patatin-like phospholipase family protein [Streptosporangiales bacterium]
MTRTGVVLGAGGVLGASWMIGALYALQEATGFDPRSADYLVGTSAGAVLAASLSSGVGPQTLVDNQLGVIVEGAPRLDFDPDTVSGGKRPPRPRPGIGSRRLLLNSWLHPRHVHPLVALYSVVPEGRGTLEPVGRVIDSVLAYPAAPEVPAPADQPGGWSPHPHCWLVAVDYDNGRRTVFGRPDAPEAPLRDAVMASCAVPGWYHPVHISGRRYVDGGVRSSTSADLLCRADIDFAYVLAPMASYSYDQPRSVSVAVERGVRRLTTKQVAAEVTRLRRAGIAVEVITPGPDDLRAIGSNLMDPARRVPVLETALRTTPEQLGGSRVRKDS